MKEERKEKKMLYNFLYPANIKRDEDGQFLVTFPDFNWGGTEGDTREEALIEAKDLLRELLTTTMRKGQDFPPPSRPTQRRPLVSPPAEIVLQAILYSSIREVEGSIRELSRTLDVSRGEIKRYLNPDHLTQISTIETVIQKLGKTLIVTVDKTN